MRPNSVPQTSEESVVFLKEEPKTSILQSIKLQQHATAEQKFFASFFQKRSPCLFNGSICLSLTSGEEIRHA
jgi:hypothetical protein